MEPIGISGVTIGIVVKNQAKNIVRCLNSLPRLAKFPIELFIVDHYSTDGTVEEILRNRPIDLDLRLYQNKENHLGNSRDFILRNAKFPFVCFIDSDCEAPPGWPDSLLIPLIRAKGKKKIIGAGGENAPPKNSNSFYSALRIMLSSPLGHGNSTQAKQASQLEEVSHVPTCNLLLDKEEAIRIGGFSSEFSFVCEDLEFSRRAEAYGYLFLFIPNAKVLHWHDDSYFSWARKMFRYGRGQILVQRKHSRHLWGARALPLISVLGFIAIGIFDPRYLFVILTAYFLSLLAVSGYLTTKEGGGILTVVRVSLLFVCTHFAYGFGELFELLNANGKIKHKKMHHEKWDENFLLLDRST